MHVCTLQNTWGNLDMVKRNLGYICAALLLTLSGQALALNQDEALDIALSHSKVDRHDLSKLKIERDREDDITVFKLEFETTYGDFDYCVTVNSGDIIKIDYEIDEDKLRLAPGVGSVDADGARRLAASQARGADPSSVRLKAEGESREKRYEAVFFANGMKYEIEINAAHGVIIDLNAQRR